MSVTVKCIAQGPISANTYIVIDDATQQAVLIDMGDCTPELLTAIAPLKIQAILLTHGHFDHILGVAALQKKIQAPLMIHKADARALSDNRYNLSAMNGTPMTEHPKADRLLEDGDEIHFGASTLQVLHTPGHTTGGVTYMDCENRLLFTGDTLFCITAGRTDFEGGSFEDLMASLIRLSRLDGDFTVYPGHNRSTTLDYERTHNRYLRRIGK